MLRKIPIQHVRIGMFVHEVCGSWLDHPFWRASFKIDTARQLQQLAVVKEVIIDTSKGLDVAGGETQVALMDDVEVSTVEAGSSALMPLEGPLESDPDEAPLANSVIFQQEIVRASRIV